MMTFGARSLRLRGRSGDAGEGPLDATRSSSSPSEANPSSSLLSTCSGAAASLRASSARARRRSRTGCESAPDRGDASVSDLTRRSTGSSPASSSRAAIVGSSCISGSSTPSSRASGSVTRPTWRGLLTSREDATDRLGSSRRAQGQGGRKTRKSTIAWRFGAFQRDSSSMDEHYRQLLLLGREHYERGEYERAAELLEQVGPHTDRFADVFDMLGVISHGRGELTQARVYFEKAVSLNPNYTEAQLNLMVTLNDLGEYDRARQIYSGIRYRGGGGKELDPFAKGKI